MNGVKITEIMFKKENSQRWISKNISHQLKVTIVKDKGNMLSNSTMRMC